MVIGSARNVRLTKPPMVATPHPRKKSAKKARPRVILAARETGTSGVSAGPAGRSLDEARVDGGGDVRLRLDDAELEEQVGGLLAEGLDLSRKELAVRLAILPAEIRLRLLELLARLLDHGAHDLEALLRLAPDPLDGLDVAVHHALRQLLALLAALRRAADGVHHHRIVGVVRDDLARLALVRHGAEIGVD